MEKFLEFFVTKTQMGHQISKVSKSVKPTTVSSKPKFNDISPDIARNMNKMNIKAVNTKSESTVKSRPIPNKSEENISYMNCQALFKDALNLNTKDLSEKYRISEDLVKKLTKAYSWPKSAAIDQGNLKEFGRKHN
eukprot:NODE_66_length_25735_cov_0.318497.p22 type:complete len:136 gc:universal NODE_66_length_25735_cov_0.318497:17717-17310(-)